MEQDPLKETPDNDIQSPEVTSKVATLDHEAKESPKKLIEKLSAALVNVSAKEDLVKQHAKVAEEAVAGIFHCFVSSTFFNAVLKIILSRLFPALLLYMNHMCK